MGYSYYISFTDDYSRETKVQFLKHKSEALTAFKQYEANITRQHPGIKLCKVHSDRGGEYLSAEFDQYLKNQGIKRKLTVHPSPHQNGVAERFN
jgi:transposase InsO family protein